MLLPLNDVLQLFKWKFCILETQNFLSVMVSILRQRSTTKPQLILMDVLCVESSFKQLQLLCSLHYVWWVQSYYSSFLAIILGNFSPPHLLKPSHLICLYVSLCSDIFILYIISASLCRKIKLNVYLCWRCAKVYNFFQQFLSQSSTIILILCEWLCRIRY